MKLNLKIVSINPEGDGVTCLYINNMLHMYGDYYHNKIDDWIAGFVAGLNFDRPSTDNIEPENWYVLGESYEDPDQLEDLMLNPPSVFAALPALTQEY
jgi:hypothetical protein